MISSYFKPIGLNLVSICWYLIRRIYSPHPFYGVTTVEGELVDWNSVENRMRTRYNIFVSHKVGYKIDTWKKLDQARKITFHGPTVLYSDWEWFQSISGGINSIGIGIGPVSGSRNQDCAEQRCSYTVFGYSIGYGSGFSVSV